MPRIALQQISTAVVADGSRLYPQIRTILDDLENQLRSQPLISSRTDSKQEQGLQRGDPMFRFTGGTLQVGVFDGKRPRFLTASDLQSLQNRGTNFLGRKTGTALVTAASTLALFPNQEDWGFYDRTSTTDLFLVYNYDGATLFKVQLL
jgi:hypothetical protein